jgi:polysaccharide export outer membrane protein
MIRRLRSVALAAFASFACADVGQYVWATDYHPAAPEERAYVLGPGDLIDVRMFGQDAFGMRARVRTDGMVTLSLLGDVQAAGFTPAALGHQLETRYKDFIKNPSVTVSVEEARPLVIAVAGEVSKPGVISAPRGATLLEVLLLAGGPTDFAHSDRIFVLRNASPPTRIRFKWQPLIRGGPGTRFVLMAGDTIVVE